VKVVWTKEALSRLAEIENFISQDSPGRAERFLQYLLDRGDSVFENPQIGRVGPEISNPNIREIIARGYRIVYRIQEKVIEILTVFEGHMLLDIDELDADLSDSPE
jgi:plasmid stabilization system protein ParE